MGCPHGRRAALERQQKAGMPLTGHEVSLPVACPGRITLPSSHVLPSECAQQCLLLNISILTLSLCLLQAPRM